MIGVTSDVKGCLILAGDTNVIGSIGEAMLSSLSGELGNMLVGGTSTAIVKNELKTDIIRGVTAP